jgi:DNA-binding NtrC family response regulator
MGDEVQLNILVIDDDEDMRQLLIEILLPEQHQVFAAGSAEEGLQLLPYTTFDVAFLDQNLPGMEGLVLGEYLRKNNPEMTIALVTGSEDTRLGRLGERLDIRVIKKPFEVRQIFEVLDAHRRSRRTSLDARPPEADKRPSLLTAQDVLREAYQDLHVPERLAEKLVRVVRARLAELRTARRYAEADRVVAYAGLVTLEVLGVDAPKMPSGLTLYEEYDALMDRHGLERAFSSED